MGYFLTPTMSDDAVKQQLANYGAAAAGGAGVAAIATTTALSALGIIAGGILTASGVGAPVGVPMIAAGGTAAIGLVSVGGAAVGAHAYHRQGNEESTALEAAFIGASGGMRTAGQYVSQQGDGKTDLLYTRVGGAMTLAGENDGRPTARGVAEEGVGIAVGEYSSVAGSTYSWLTFCKGELNRGSTEFRP